MKLKGLVITLFTVFTLSSGKATNCRNAINYSTNSKTGRPYWLNQGEIKFLLKTPHKTPNLETIFTDVQTKYKVMPNNKQDLAHIISWHDIEKVVDQWNKDTLKGQGWDLKPFTTYLTRVDNLANLWTSTGSDVKHKTILDENLDLGNKNSINKALNTVNTAIQECLDYELDPNNTPNIQLIKKLLNSAPANLRYSERSANRNVKGFLDPMGRGNLHRQLTSKEKSMIVATDPQTKFLIVDHPKQVHNFGMINFKSPQIQGIDRDIALYFQNTIMKHVKDNTLRGTYYEQDSPGNVFTNKNQKFNPLVSTKSGYKYKKFVKSSSQSTEVSVGGGDTINFYVTYD